MVPIPKKESETRPQLVIGLNREAIKTVENLRIARLRVIFQDEHFSVYLVLRNTKAGLKLVNEEAGNNLHISIKADWKDFQDTLHDDLKVLFKSDERFALFELITIVRDSLFSKQETLEETIAKIEIN